MTMSEGIAPFQPAAQLFIAGSSRNKASNHKHVLL